MTRPLRTLLVLCVAALALAALAAPSAMAKKKEACWRTLINDWYDGVIDDTYPLACYRQALNHIHGDVEAYSTAREDINRAYQARIAEIRKDKKKDKGTPTKHDDPSSGDTSQSAGPSVPSKPGGGDGGNGQTGIPTITTKEPTTKPPTQLGGSKVVRSNEKGPVMNHLPPTNRQPSTQPGRQDPDGPIPAAIGKLGPDSADSLPIPLLVLAGLALLLMFGGVLGFLSRRFQSRRPPMRPATAPADTRRR